jgi:threonine aldolase
MTCGERTRKIPGIQIVYKVEANGVFAKIPREVIAKLQKRYFFYVWNEEHAIVRWMCSFDTTEEDVKQFVKFVAETIAA